MFAILLFFVNKNSYITLDIAGDIYIYYYNLPNVKQNLQIYMA